MSLQWKRGLQRLYFLVAVLWILTAGSFTFWRVHLRRASACDQVRLAEAVKRNAALHNRVEMDATHDSPVIVDFSKAQPIAGGQPQPVAHASTAQAVLKNQHDYARLPDGSYAQFRKGTTPDKMRSMLESKGLPKPGTPGGAEWYEFEGPDGEWYETQAASPEEARAKLSERWRRADEVAEAGREGIGVNVLESLEYNRRICASDDPARRSLEVAIIPALLGYALFRAGCWVASGFNASR